MRSTKDVLLVLSILLLCSFVFAVTINVPADQPTIQAGIDAATNGDIVLVQTGTYTENIDFSGKNIIVCSNYQYSNNIADIENTIIDGGQNDTVVKFINNENSTAYLIGFSIINGQAVMGGGISCNSSTPVIQYNIIRNNTADIGGGILAINSSPQIINNTIINNSDYGLRCLGTNVEMNNCILWNNIPDQILVNNNDEIDATYSDIKNSWEGIGNIEIDPLFENIFNNEFQLQLLSPCKNTGDPHLVGDSDGTRSDMGALFCTNNDVELYADMLVDISSGYYPLEIHFQDYSEAFNTTITIWSWQFGDGDTSTEVNPMHTYSEPGFYTVSLAISDGVGNYDSIMFEDFIEVLPDYYGGDTLYIALDGSNISGNGSEENPFETIQHAIDIADNGKTLIAYPGTYYENLQIYNKEITLGSFFILSNDEAYIQNTIIDGFESGSVISINLGVNFQIIISGMTITNGLNENGGGLNILDSSVSLNNLNIVSNSAMNDGGGLYVEQSNFFIRDCEIHNNYCGNILDVGAGGGLYLTDLGDGTYIYEISESKIFQNTSRWGGGIYCDYSDGTVYNSRITDNVVSAWGGGIELSRYSDMNIINCLVVNNSSYTGAGGIMVSNNSDIVMQNSTIANNQANTGGGICFFIDTGSVSSINNSIFANNNPSELRLNNDVPIPIEFSLIEGGESSLEDYNGWEISWGEGNLFTDPVFDSTGVYPFALSEFSLCIDAGTPDTTGLNLPSYDLIGNLRVWDGNGNGDSIIDMGAYEYDAPSYVDIEDNLILQTSEVRLQQNYPNPFNPTTTISFSIPIDSKIDITVFNIKGQKIQTVSNCDYNSGSHSIVWNGVDESGKAVSSGVYFYKLNINGKTDAVKKCLLLK